MLSSMNCRMIKKSFIEIRRSIIKYFHLFNVIKIRNHNLVHSLLIKKEEKRLLIKFFESFIITIINLVHNFRLPAGRAAQGLVFCLSNDFMFTNTIQKCDSVRNACYVPDSSCQSLPVLTTLQWYNHWFDYQYYIIHANLL